MTCGLGNYKKVAGQYISAMVRKLNISGKGGRKEEEKKGRRRERSSGGAILFGCEGEKRERERKRERE